MDENLEPQADPKPTIDSVADEVNEQGEDFVDSAE